jgi:hypothetical protein
MAVNASVPNSFTDGTATSAPGVNANFDALVSWINTNAVHLDASKSFTAVPSGPATDPTTANHLTRKSYVDALVAAVSARLPVVAADITDLNVTTAKIANLGVTTGKIADLAVTTAKLADTSVSNAKLLNGAGEPGGGWNSWTPTLTGTWAAGNATFNCAYKLVGKMCHVRFFMTVGTTTTKGAGRLQISNLPYTSEALAKAYFIGDAGPAAGLYPMFPHLDGTTVIGCYVGNASGTYLSKTSMTNTVPATFGTGDGVAFSGVYEIA